MSDMVMTRAAAPVLGPLLPKRRLQSRIAIFHPPGEEEEPDERPPTFIEQVAYIMLDLFFPPAPKPEHEQNVFIHFVRHAQVRYSSLLLLFTCRLG